MSGKNLKEACGFSAAASRLDLSGPRPPRVWRSGGAVWIACSGCARSLRLTEIPAGQIACPDCHQIHQYNLAGREIPEQIPDQATLAHVLRLPGVARATVGMFAAAEWLSAQELRVLLDAIYDKMNEYRRSNV